MSERLAEAARDLAQALLAGPSPAGLGACPLPDPADAAVVVDRARTLLFPEVDRWEPGAAGEGAPGGAIRTAGDRLARLLVQERHAGCASPARAGSCAPCGAWAEQLVLALFSRLPALRELLSGDLDAGLAGDPAARSAAEIVLCYPGFHAVAVQRLAHVLWGLGAPLVARLLTEQCHVRTGIDLHPGASFGRGVFIDHGTGVVVGETAVIGEGVRLYQGVTLGARSVGKDDVGRLRGVKRHPTLEDEVIVYANATILGGDTRIGRGAIIGANAWITASVPAGARVAGAA